MKTCIALLAILTAITPAAAAAGKQVLSNSHFTGWSHGSPVRGAFGAGRETANGWVSKWNKSPASVAVASRAPGGGLRYTLHPDPKIHGGDGPGGGETFYLRQYYRPLSASLGKTFTTKITLRSHTAGVQGGWYIYPLWNATQRLFFINTVASIPLSARERATYTKTFTVPTGKGVHFHLDPAHAGLAVAFLFTTAHPAVVDIGSFEMFRH